MVAAAGCEGVGRWGAVRRADGAAIGRERGCGGRWQCMAGCWVEAMNGMAVVELAVSAVPGGTSGVVAAWLGVVESIVLPPNKAAWMHERLASCWVAAGGVVAVGDVARTEMIGMQEAAWAGAAGT